MESDTGESDFSLYTIGPGVGWRLLYKSDGDARHLASTKIAGFGLTYFWGDGKSLRAVHKEIYQKCCNPDHTEISFRGQFKLEV